MRFVEEENQIRDTQTGLIWQRSYKSNLSFDEALEYATELSNETGLKWRVPSIEELHTLVDRSRSFPASYFPCVSSNAFWSSSPYVGDTNFAWYVDFGMGDVSNDGRRRGYAVRLIRYE